MLARYSGYYSPERNHPEKVCMENLKAAKLEKLKRLQDAVKKLVHLRSIKKLKESRAVITACSSFEL